MRGNGGKTGLFNIWFRVFNSEPDFFVVYFNWSLKKSVTSFRLSVDVN
jgi:hypothetical protein